MPLGATMPAFCLPDIEGNLVSPEDADNAKAFVVAFICNHCPYVKHVRTTLARLGNRWQNEGIAFYAINANDPVTYPDDSPANMVREARDAGYEFPYLFDETQEVAREFHAACTPDVFVYDKSRKLVYRGQIDDSRPGNGLESTGADLEAAVASAVAGKPHPEPHKPSVGCGIKWRPGKESL
jgi:thiol-disulfide isomerase/thioredoxin